MVARICDTKCGTPPGGGAGAYSATKISNAAPFAAPALEAVVPFDTAVFDVGPAITPDLDGDALVINQDGFYEITATHTWTGGGTETVAISVNGVVVQRDSAENPGTRAGSLSVLLQLSAGDVVQLLASSDAGDTVLATLSAEKRN